ncbi:MAG: sugar transferase [Candidatus Pacebacteria bacterium]|nr:sugar transferase [Candidatus Paceibacterota bacterium]
MLFQAKKEAIILLLGDVIIFVFSLWAMLFINYEGLPTMEEFSLHFEPFSILFIVWIIVFFIAGLYEKHTTILKNKLPSIILNTQIINVVIAITFFYLIPYFGITPKTNLFVYLVISLFLVLVWRLNGYKLFGSKRKQNALLIGSGKEMEDLKTEVNNNNKYALSFVSSVDLEDLSNVDFQGEIVKRIYADDINIIVADLKNDKVRGILPHLYNLIFSHIRFFDMHKVYEDIFDRVPLSLVQYNWFIENISTAPRLTYDFVKRTIDIILGLIFGLISLVLYPFIALVIKLDDGGSIFFLQERVGENNKHIKIIKFRSMSDGKVTKVGHFLRVTRLDEVPQLWNVLYGDLSLIGPRPEIPELVGGYEEQIPYYNIRHLIKPGLSGWAQLYHDNHPHHASDVAETKVKLSYDLFYIKNRSVILDLKIALKTLKKLISRAGK